MEPLKITNASKTYAPVAEFYAGKSVLITGGTGFLGKVLIEKLVYSCPNLENVYVLVRDKKNVPGHDRFHRILESKLFTRIRQEKPEYLKKIYFIKGDITLSDLGINEEDKTIILAKVSIVFHLAATIRFDEPLKNAMKINLEGTRNMIQLSQKMKDLQAFLYMSTAFCNTNRKIVEEVVYPPPMKIEDVYTLLEKNGDADEASREITKSRPNTYTFTKALTESFIAECCEVVPISIIRPSMVVAAMHEPIPGWIESWQGPTPALDMCARGWLRCHYGKKHYALDIIPVDYVINATIVAATRCCRSENVTVYNCSTSVSNTITLEDISKLYSNESLKAGYNDLPLNNVIFTKSEIILKLLQFMFLVLPAYFSQFINILMRKPTKYVKLMQRFLVYLDLIKYFTSRNWFTTSTRLQELADELDDTDRQKFPCDPARISWSEFMPAYFNGVREFLIGATGNVHE